MGRAGGGSRGGGGRSGGGSFSRSSMGGSRNSSRSFSRSSSGSRQSSNSFNRTSHGGSSFGGANFGGGFGGGFGGFRGTPYGGASQRPRPIFINPGYGRKTVIINNSGNHTYSGNNTTGTHTNTASNTATSGTAQTVYTAPKELTPEQKIARAERLAKEAADNKKGSVKFFFLALILLVVGMIASLGAKKDEFQKYDLKGTVDVGYVYDDEFTYNGGKTEAACKEFYDATGIPLFFYTVGEYDKDASTCDIYTAATYDTLFKDENHVIIAYFNNVDWWSWYYGANVSEYMADGEINDLIDEIYRYWDDTSLSNDAVLAKGIASYQEKLTASKSSISGLAVVLCIAGLVMLVVAIYQFINYGSDAKKYEEEAKRLQRDLILSKPLETFGNQEVEDLKDKYDKM